MDDEILLRQLRVDASLLGLALDDEQLLQLSQFEKLLLRWNQAFNIISRKDESRLTTRHLLDSLSIAPWVQGFSVLDMGTGGGLPGIPLAICLRDQQFTPLDRSERKIRFVTQVKRALGLENVHPICADVRELPQGTRYDCIVSRAVADAETNWRLAAPRLREGGRLLIMASTGSEERASSEDFPIQNSASVGAPGTPHLVYPEGSPEEAPEEAKEEAPEGSRHLTREYLRIPRLNRTHRLDVLMRAAEPDTAE